MDNIKKIIENPNITNFFIIITIIIVITIIISLTNNYSECKKNENLELISEIHNDNDSTYADSNDNTNNIDTNDKTNKENQILSFYYMNGCGYCNIFKSEWEKIKNTIRNTDLINILTLKENNCAENPSGCLADGDYIKGFPTILLTKNDGSKILYNDYPRTHDSVLLFLKNNM